MELLKMLIKTELSVSSCWRSYYRRFSVDGHVQSLIPSFMKERMLTSKNILMVNKVQGDAMD